MDPNLCSWNHIQSAMLLFLSALPWAILCTETAILFFAGRWPRRKRYSWMGSISPVGEAVFGNWESWRRTAGGFPTVWQAWYRWEITDDVMGSETSCLEVVTRNSRKCMRMGGSQQMVLGQLFGCGCRWVVKRNFCQGQRAVRRGIVSLHYNPSVQC